MTCQVCGKKERVALRCWHQFDEAYQDDEVPQALAAMTTSNGADEQWMVDLGVSAHMTTHSGILQNLRPYHGCDHVMVDNGTMLPITHIGETYVGNPPNSIKFDNGLLVLDLEKNLLSIGQLTTDYPINCEYFGVGFTIKDSNTNRILLTGHKQGNLYSLAPPPRKLIFQCGFQL